jgi:hypothetical protein
VRQTMKIDAPTAAAKERSAKVQRVSDTRRREGAGTAAARHTGRES